MSDKELEEMFKDMLRRDSQKRFEEMDDQVIDQETFDNIQEEALNKMFPPKKKSGCFIATAAFGSKYSEEVLVLKRWRDLFLLKTKYGQIIVKIYYYFSPPIAQLIKNNRFLKKTVINFLKPIIYLLRSKYDNKT